MRFSYVAAAALVLLTAYRPALAAIGDVDPLYGQGGRVVGAPLLLADGRALGPANNDYGGNDYLRFDASGHADSGFGNQGRQAWPDGFVPNWNVWLRHIDGSTLLGGSLGASAAIVRLDATGQIDPMFAGGGVLVLPPTRMSRSEMLGLALQPDGKLLVLSGEYFAAYYMDAPVLVLLRRLDASLNADPGFGKQGEVLVADYALGETGNWEVYGQNLTLLKDGRIKLTDQYSQEPVPPELTSRTRLSYVDANGAPSTQPLPDPTLDTLIRDWRLVGRSPDGGMLIDGFTSGVAGNHYRLFRLYPDGRPDTTFGNAGSFTFDGGTGEPVLSHPGADSRYLYISQQSSNDTTVRRVQLQGATPGQLDTSFGRQGVVRFAVSLGLRTIQDIADGSALLVASETFRLLPTSAPSPGILSFEVTSAAVSVPGPFTVRVTRSGGSDGAVTVDFATAPASSAVYNRAAVSGKDFLPLSGQLAWADGESGDRIVTLTILPDYLNVDSNAYKPFYLQLDHPGGGSLIAISRLVIYNQYRDGTSSAPAAAANPVAPAQGAGGSGGGGALDLLSLLIVVVACVARQLRIPCSTNWS